jgi:hypothetical protein
LTHIDARPEFLVEVFNKLKDRKNETSEFRFGEIRSKLAAAFPFDQNGYDYVAITDIKESLKDSVLTASPSEMYKAAKRGLAAAMDDRNYTEFRPDIPEELKEYLTQFKGEVSRTRFATLKTRKTIYEHIDNDAEHTIRIHIPIFTDKYSLFGVRLPSGETQTLHMKVGSVYFLNTGLPHWVINGSPDVDRTHLIVNLNSTEDIRDLLHL